MKTNIKWQTSPFIIYNQCASVSSGHHNREVSSQRPKCYISFRFSTFAGTFKHNQEPWLRMVLSPGPVLSSRCVFFSFIILSYSFKCNCKPLGFFRDAWQRWDVVGHARFPLCQYIPELWFISSLNPPALHKSAQSLEREKVYVNCTHNWEYGVSEVISQVLIFSIKCHYSMISLHISHILNLEVV